jgi:stringent starvation protein B
VRFHARFGGVSREIYVPVNNVMAIYANENGQGMAFEPQIGSGTGADSPASDLSSVPSPSSSPSSSPVLSIAPAPALSAVPSSAPALHGAPKSEVSSGSDGDDEPPKKGPRPTLTRIK